ncbi:MAG: hypothetical protein HQK54_09625 [Oligoflexales bacterium]|nr:hypothetical protein [Oligoflexales bacterium]
MQRVNLLIFILSSAFVPACAGDSNMAKCKNEKKDISTVTSREEVEKIETSNGPSGCSYLTYRDDVRTKLDEKKYDEAISILTKLIEFYPEDFDLYGQIAASYAAIAGVESPEFIRDMTTTNGFFETGKAKFPSDGPAWISAKSNIGYAIQWFNTKVALQASPTLSASDRLMGSVYRMAESMIVTNRVLEKNASGKWDQERLKSLTTDDVNTIVDNMDTIVNTIQDEALKQKFKEFQGSRNLTDEQKKQLIIEAIQKENSKT